MIELRLLGGLAVRASDQRATNLLVRRPKRAALLAYLAAAVPYGLHRRDKLLALFWPELDEPHARAALSQSLYILRSVLGARAIVTAGDEEIGLDPAELWCDVRAFAEALETGRPADALTLYGGDLLDGVFVTGAPEFEHWLDRERQRLRLDASEGAWKLAKESASEGDVMKAERWARRGADFVPADEAAVRRLMSFLSGLGDRAAAIRAYEAFAWNLAREYELTPSSETTAMAATIRGVAPAPVLDKLSPPTAYSASPVWSPVSETDAAPNDASPSALPNELPERDAKSSPRWSPRRRAFTALGALLVLIVTAPEQSAPSRNAAAAAHGPPRLMVLPFRNLGASSDSYLADGITDEISARLASVRDLAVIGGRASARYATTKTSPRQIAAETGVSYVLEGSVSWENGPGVRRVRVRPRLVRARDETEVWATVLDEDLAHMPALFTLLGGITQRVVDQLHVETDAVERRGIVAIPTSSQQAYEAYLRGRDFKRRSWSELNTSSAIRMFESAVEQDPAFALAWAWLSFAHTDAEWLNGLGGQHLELARRAGERALQLDSSLADAHVAMGHYYYACCADYERAAWHMELGALKRPGDSWISMLIGNVHKRQGRWDEATRYYERAIAADPRWVAPMVNLAQLQLWTRRYDDAQRTITRALAINPQEAFLHSFQIWIPLLRRGDTAAAQRFLDEAGHVSDSYDKMRLPFYLAVIRRDYSAALRLRLPTQRADDNAGDLDEGLPSDAVREGLVALLRGDSAAAHAQFLAARADLDGLLRRRPAHSRRAEIWLHASLALTLAGLGEKNAAIEQAKEVLQLDPVGADAIDGPIALQDIALAFTLAGEKNRALEVLEQLVRVPARFSSEVLRLDPLWDSLRGESKYRQLLRSREPLSR